MIAAVGGKDYESAESYFKNIEEQTGTLILWPSKLKIGAKSKKGELVLSYASEGEKINVWRLAAMCMHLWLENQ